LAREMEKDLERHEALKIMENRRKGR